MSWFWVATTGAGKVNDSYLNLKSASYALVNSTCFFAFVLVFLVRDLLGRMLSNLNQHNTTSIALFNQLLTSTIVRLELFDNL